MVKHFYTARNTQRNSENTEENREEEDRGDLGEKWVSQKEKEQ